MNPQWVRLFTWDWKAQPNVDRIDTAMGEVYSGSCRPKLYPVDSHGDSYVLLVSGYPLADAQATYEAWEWE